MKIAVITAVAGDKIILEDNIKFKGHYIAYLDKESIKRIPLKEFFSSKWEMHKMEEKEFRSHVKNAKRYKILSHLYTNADYIIWHDANISLNISPEDLVNKWLDNKYDFATFKHPIRDCIYEEGLECIRISKGSSSVIKKQLGRYRKMGYPEHNGLAETGVIVKRNNKNIRKLSELWWREVCNGSERDQLSFPVIFNGKYRAIEGNVRENKDFNYI